MIFFPVTRSKR